MNISNCNRFLVTAGEDGNIIIWDLNSKYKQFNFSHSKSVKVL